MRSTGEIAFNSRRNFERVERGEGIELVEDVDFFGVVKEENLVGEEVAPNLITEDVSKIEEYVGKEECCGVEVRVRCVNELLWRLDQM